MFIVFVNRVRDITKITTRCGHAGSTNEGSSAVASGESAAPVVILRLCLVMKRCDTK